MLTLVSTVVKDSTSVSRLYMVVGTSEVIVMYEVVAGRV